MKLIKFLRARENRTFILGIWSIVYGAVKIILAVLSQSNLVFIYSFYSFGIGYAKIKSSKGYNKKKTYNDVGLIITFSSLVYIFYSFILLFVGTEAEYDLYVSIGLAAVIFFEAINAVQGVLNAKKADDLQRETISFLNLATASISMSVVQTALLSAAFNGEGDISWFFAIGYIMFGFISLGMGVFMLRKNLGVEVGKTRRKVKK